MTGAAAWVPAKVNRNPQPIKQRPGLGRRIDQCFGVSAADRAGSRRRIARLQEENR